MAKWVWSRNSKEYQKALSRSFLSTREAFRAIINDYHLHINESDIYQEAQAYAFAKTDSEFLILTGTSPATMAGATFTAFLTAVLTIIFPPAGAAAWSLWGIALSIEVAAISFAFYKEGFLDNRLSFQYKEAANISQQAQATKNAATAQKSQLTRHLIYQPYAICANGEIYTSGAAGSQSFTPTQAYDPTKGLRGDYNPPQIDDVIYNRHQTKLAGNAEFNLAEQEGLPAKIINNYKQRNDELKKEIKDRDTQIREGFKKLVENNFGFWDSGKHIERYYKNAIKQRIDPLKNIYRQNDMLEKLQSYSRGEMADFDYQYLTEKKLTLQRQREILDELIKSYESKLNDKKDRIEKGAVILGLFISFLSSFYKYLGELKGWDYKPNAKDVNEFEFDEQAEFFFTGQGLRGHFGNRIGNVWMGIKEERSGFLHTYTQEAYFRNESAYKRLSKIRFETLGWGGVLAEMRYIQDSYGYGRYRTLGSFDKKEGFHFLIPSTAVYWYSSGIFGLWSNEARISYIRTYRLDTAIMENYRTIWDTYRTYHLSDSEWDRAWQIYLQGG